MQIPRRLHSGETDDFLLTARPVPRAPASLRLGLLALLWGGMLAPPGFAAAPPPNFVVFLTDNMGNGDLGCFGSKVHRTPNVDRVVAEGMTFTSFYAASPVCTATRASLMTGCYPLRVDMHAGANNAGVIQPISRKGMNPEESTIAEVLKTVGYATGIFGKWHLGDQPEFLPTRQGFDEFFGLPYAENQGRRPDVAGRHPSTWPELPLMRGEKVIEAPPDRDFLIQRTTEEAIGFLERNHRRPFFIYVAQAAPGSTARPFFSPAFQGKSANGAYGDCIEELDWSTGAIMATLKRLGVDGNTLLVWTADNGPVERHPPQGSAAPYKGFGYSTSEGGQRMPCIMRWPGRIPAGVTSDAIATTMDLLPTFAALARAPLPARPIDGHDIGPLIFERAGNRSPWDEVGFCYYQLEQLQAVRAGPWKLYLPFENKYQTHVGLRNARPSRTELYDVRHDVSEEREVSAKHPEVVQRLRAMAERTRREIGDTGVTGQGHRPAGWVETARPLLLLAPGSGG